MATVDIHVKMVLLFLVICYCLHHKAFLKEPSRGKDESDVISGYDNILTSKSGILPLKTTTEYSSGKYNGIMLVSHYIKLMRTYFNPIPTGGGTIWSPQLVCCG